MAHMGGTGDPNCQVLSQPSLSPLSNSNPRNMCYGRQRPQSEDEPTPPSRRRLLGLAFENAVAQLYRIRLAEAEARLQRARAREAEINRLIKELRRFVSVMEILDAYLNRCLVEHQQELDRLTSLLKSLCGDQVCASLSDADLFSSKYYCCSVDIDFRCFSTCTKSKFPRDVPEEAATALPQLLLLCSLPLGDAAELPHQPPQLFVHCSLPVGDSAKLPHRPPAVTESPAIGSKIGRIATDLLELGSKLSITLGSSEDLIPNHKDFGVGYGDTMHCLVMESQYFVHGHR
ncbi:hypothetical protein RJ640_020156 [Escallonia rubra]|uniref:Uncharacterized protein n=1 Tax=Escallonia rubra TaxID=112253 RepID=A0AA88QX23_9ASTE|nr:hypothetical protein RJ640_020156 [Escallonia rubra]